MDRKFSTKCSNCRERTVVMATIPYEIQINHDGRNYQVTVPDLNTPKCTKCGQIYFDGESSEQISRVLRKQAGLLQPEEIRLQREKVGLTLEQVSELLDVTLDTYMGWESGALIQMRSQDRFLRAFFRMPELRKTLADKQALELSPIHS